VESGASLSDPATKRSCSASSGRPRAQRGTRWAAGCTASETHNDEFKLVRKLEVLLQPAQQADGLLIGLELFFGDERGFGLQHSHVSEGGSRRVLRGGSPDRRGYVLPTGVDVFADGPSSGALAAPNKVEVFIGSLGVKINLDALRLFGEAFCPVMRRVGEELRGARRGC